MTSRAVRAASKPALNALTVVDEGLLLIDTNLETVAADDGAMSILKQENPGDEEPRRQASLPGEIEGLLRATGPSGRSFPKLTFRIGKVSYSCRIFPLRYVEEVHSKPLFALHFQRCSSVADAIHTLASEYNLTEREQQALEAIAAGLTSKEIANKMNISPNTVKSFLRIIMLKLAVGSRAALVGKLVTYTNGTAESHKR